MSGSQEAGSMASSAAAQAPQPVKIGEIRNHHLDSRRWNDFKFRKGDIVYVTYPKSGKRLLQLDSSDWKQEKRLLGSVAAEDCIIFSCLVGWASSAIFAY